MNNTDHPIIAPGQKLIFGLLFIPAYLLQQSIIIRTIQFVILISVYILQGGKLRIAPNLMLVSGIILAYTLRPAGKLLFMLGDFPVTEGALISGLTKALMLIGLIYISRLSVSSKLNLKGKAGNLFGRVFYYFEAITEGQGSFHFRYFYKPGAAGRLISYIDDLLDTVEGGNILSLKPESGTGSSFFSVSSVFVLVLISLSYLLLLPTASL